MLKLGVPPPPLHIPGRDYHKTIQPSLLIHDNGGWTETILIQRNRMQYVQRKAVTHVK